jgi:preprotein translocase subunit SecY
MSDDLKEAVVLFQVLDRVETSDYLDKVMSLITFPGSLFLALIAVFPAIVVSLMDVQQSWAMFWRYLINNYGWCCHRHNSTNKFILVK